LKAEKRGCAVTTQPKTVNEGPMVQG